MTPRSHGSQFHNHIKKYGKVSCMTGLKTDTNFFQSCFLKMIKSTLNEEFKATLRNFNTFLTKTL